MNAPRRTHFHRPYPAALVAAVLVVAGCGGGHSDTTEGMSAPAGVARAKALAVRADLPDLLSLVNPFVGTKIGNSDPANQGTGGGVGNTFPGATLPFNMVQFSPDTGYGESGSYGGYAYDKGVIQGLSLIHLSGTGCSVAQNISMMPIVGDVTQSPATHLSTYQSGYSHANEQAVPGFYRVGLNNGINTEITVTKRSGFGRFTYPANAATMIFNTGRNGLTPYGAQLQIVGNDSVQGYVTSPGVCGVGTYTVYFYGQFDRAFASFGTYQGDTLKAGVRDALESTNNGGWVKFANGGQIKLRMGVSYVSSDNAKLNMQTENPNWDFDGIKASAQATWSAALNKVQVTGGANEDRIKFYTALYHTLLHPNLFSDVNNQYIGFDKQIRTTTGWNKYNTYSGWDIYRSQVQLLGWLMPTQASDMAQSLVVDAQAGGGGFVKWGTANDDSCVMTGDPGTVIVANLYAFGGHNFDTATALNLMDTVAGTPGIKSRGCETRPAVGDYVNKGYVPTEATNVWGSAATTLEYAVADSAIAQFADALGDTGRRDTYLSRGQRWKNLFSNGTGYITPRDAAGSFKSGFTPGDGSGFVEGDSAQYTWMVPQNFRGLIDRMGGNAAAIVRLDEHFTQIDAGPNSVYAFMGNEPEHGAPRAYNFAGAPYKSQAVIRRVMDQVYKSGADGLTGNDDLGATSAWYVWSALGLYPEIPGLGGFVVSTPLFPDVSVLMGNGHTLHLHTDGAGANGIYLQSLTINGQAANSSWLPLAGLAGDTTLSFTAGASPNTTWGSQPPDVPPSFDAPRVVKSSTSFASDFDSGAWQPDWNDTPQIEANIGGYCCALAHMETSVRREGLAHSGASALMYSGNDNDATRSFSYNRVFDTNIAVTATTNLDYWIYPQATATNSSYVAVDLQFTDGSYLRDTGATDQTGVRVHPQFQGQGGKLRSDAWNQVHSNIGQWAAGKTISRILVGYDRPDGTGNFHGFIDDIKINAN